MKSSTHAEANPQANEEALRLAIHDLSMHQIELETQNEELLTVRTQADAMLARFFDLFDAAPVGYVIVSQAGLLVEVNLTAASLLGVARQLLDRQPIVRFIHRDDQDIYYFHRKQLAETKEPQECEVRLVRPDGTAFWARLVSIIAQDAGGQAVSRVMLSDITRLKGAEAEERRLLDAVSQERDRLAALVSSISDEVWFADIHGLFTLANPAALHEFGLVAPGLIEVTKLAMGLEVYRGDGTPRPLAEAPPLRALAGEVIRGEDEIVRTPARGELRHRQVSASPVLDAQGQVVGSVSVVRDVTEQKHAEELLQEREQLNRIAIDLSPCGMVSIGRDGRLFKVNEAYCQITGYSAEELTSMNIAELTHPDDWRSEAARFGGYLTAGTNFECEKRYVRKDGSLCWVVVSARMVTDAGGQPSYSIGVVQDITLRKRAEQALSENNDELTRFNRAMIGRELRMIELKKEINGLCVRAGEAPRYRVEVGQ